MTDHEHHIGRRFLRRCIDGSANWRTKTYRFLDAERRIADAPSYTDEHGIVFKNLQNEVMQPQEVGLGRLQIVQLTYVIKFQLH